MVFFLVTLCVKSNSNSNQIDTSANSKNLSIEYSGNWGYFILLSVMACLYLLTIVLIIQLGRRLNRTSKLFGSKNNKIPKESGSSGGITTAQLVTTIKKIDTQKKNVDLENDVKSFDYCKNNNKNS